MAIDYVDLGKRIKKYREQAGLSQIELAANSELSVQHISNVENARSKVSLDKLVTIANLLQCSVDELICGSMASGRAIYQKDIATMIDSLSDTEIKALPELLKYYDSLYKMLKDKQE